MRQGLNPRIDELNLKRVIWEELANTHDFGQ